jgi:prefoldin subunit 5
MGTLLDFQANEYNALVDQCEELQSSYGLLRLRNTELKKNSIFLLMQQQNSEDEREIHLRKRKELEDKITELTQSADSLYSTTKLLVAEKRMLQTKSMSTIVCNLKK